MNNDFTTNKENKEYANLLKKKYDLNDAYLRSIMTILYII